jgi:hypothetical protein
MVRDYGCKGQESRRSPAKATLDVAANFQSKQSDFGGKGAVYEVDAWDLVSKMAGGNEAEMLSKYYV